MGDMTDIAVLEKKSNPWRRNGQHYRETDCKPIIIIDTVNEDMLNN